MDNNKFFTDNNDETIKCDECELLCEPSVITEINNKRYCDTCLSMVAQKEEIK